jgi:hypothetical protein
MAPATATSISPTLSTTATSADANASESLSGGEQVPSSERAPLKLQLLWGHLQGHDRLDEIARRFVAFHEFVMRPKIWLACVACLSLVVLLTLVPRKHVKSTSTDENESGRTGATSVQQPMTGAPAPIVVPVPVPKTDAELMPSTALDSRGRSPTLGQPPEVPHVAERAEVARFDGVADEDENRADPLGATLGEIEAIRESGAAASEGERRP